ncbi:MAG: AMP-binding protein [Vicinamibacterales bacterium]
MPIPSVPSFHASGRWWSSDEIIAIATRFLASIASRLPSEDTPCAVALPPTAEGLALFVAASARRAPVSVFAVDPLHWPLHSTLFDEMPLALLPEQAALADEARRHGFTPMVLAPSNDAGAGAIDPLRTAGFIIQTSGSTGAPRSVYRPTSHIVKGATTRARALGLRDGDGLLGGVPFSSGQGVVQVVTAMNMGGALGMLGPVDYREVLSALARPEFACWRASAHFADVLSRVPLSRIPDLPRVCMISTPVSRAVFDAFRLRFGVPLRGAYSSTETGAIAAETAPADQVVAGTVGHPLPGVELAIGETPDAAVPHGTVSRVWVRSAWQMAGYGMPPAVERPGDVAGWWPTRDLRFDSIAAVGSCSQGAWIPASARAKGGW